MSGQKREAAHTSFVKPSRGAFAYLTLTDRSYLEIARVMLRSLALSDPAFPIRVMCFKDVTKAERLSLEVDDRIETVPIEPIELPRNVKMRYPTWARSFSRLRMFELTQFEKVVFLDADTLVLQNIDDLFARPVFSACSHQYPLLSDGIDLNAGVALLSPDQETYRSIVDELVHLPSPWPPHTWALSDQEILIAIYSSEDYAARWRQKHRIRAKHQWHLLDYRYNAIVGLQQNQAAGWDLRDVKVLHYTCGPKPWLSQVKNHPADRIWWHFQALRPRTPRASERSLLPWSTPTLRRVMK